MKLDKATVTIPYEEFEKHNKLLKEMSESNEALKERNKELSEIILIHREYMNHLMKSGTTLTAIKDINTFAKSKGFSVDLDSNMNYMFVKK